MLDIAKLRLDEAIVVIILRDPMPEGITLERLRVRLWNHPKAARVVVELMDLIQEGIVETEMVCNGHTFNEPVVVFRCTK